MSDVDYDKLIRESKANRSIDLQGSVSLGSEFNADEEARYQGLAQKSGLPVDAVRYDADRVEALQQRERIDYDKLIKESPKVSEWLRSVPNAQVAHDDVESLSAIEQAWRKVKDLGNAYVEGGLKSVGEGMQGIPEFVKSVGRTVGRATGTLDDFQNLDRVLGDYDDKLLDVLAPQAKIGREISDISKTFEIPNDRRGYDTDVAGGLGQITTQALLPGAGTLLAGAQETQQLAERAKRAGTYGTAEADAGTILGTGASYGLERLGMASVFQRLPPKLRNKVMRYASDIALAGVGEGATEALQSVSSDLFTQKLIDKEHEAFQSFGQEGAVGFGVGAIARGVLNAITPGRLRYSEDAQNAANAMQQGERLTQFLSIVKDSKLRQRSPERFESLVATFKESNAETVGVPLQALRTYAQTQNLATEALVSELTGGTGAMVEASVTGGDVRIPVEKFIASNHAIALAPDARLTPTGMTANEAAAWGEKDGGEELKALMAELEQQSQQVGPAVESSKKVYNDVYAKAIAAGEPEFRASVIARVQQSRYLARAASLGAEGKQADPYELYKSLDTQIGNELQGESSYDKGREHLGDILERNFNDPLVESYIMLTDPAESFRYPQSSTDDFVALAEESLKPLLGENVSVEKLDSNTSRVDETYNIVTKTVDDTGLEQKHTAEVHRSGKNVTLNISDNAPGAAGSAIYQSVATWAHNNGYVFIEDPAGLSEQSIFRRPEAMLSSAIRYGTAAHLGSGEMMRAPSKYLSADAVPLDLAASKSPIRDLIVATVSNVEDIVPATRNFGYDFATGKFFNKQTMTEMTDEDIAGMIRTQEGDRRLESVLFGVNSLKRAIIGRTLIDEERMLGPDKMRSLARKRAAEGKALPRVFYQQQSPMWYSAVMRAVNSAGLKKAPLKQWVQTLLNAPGVRKEELDDMGLLELAELTPDQVYSKEEFVDATQNSVLDVQEVVRGDTKLPNFDAWYVSEAPEGGEEGDPTHVIFDQDGEQVAVMFQTASGKWRIEGPRDEEFQSNYAFTTRDGLDADQALDDLKLRGNPSRLSSGRPTKHPNYVEPGGVGYRELVLTLPGQIDPYKPDTMHFTDEGGGTAIAWIRFNTRVDGEGNKILYIEEIQSKRHQDGREKGYDTEPKKNYYTAYMSDGAIFGGPDKAEVEERAKKYIQEEQSKDRFTLKAHRLRDGFTWNEPDFGSMDRLEEFFVGEYGQELKLGEPMMIDGREIQFDLVKKESAYRPEIGYHIEEEEVGGNLNRVPDAPMKNTSTWAMLAMKRMIRYAIDNDYDSVAWTPGSVQNKRWSLSNVVASIDVSFSGPDTRVVELVLHRGRTQQVWVGKDGLIVEAEDLESSVGKPLSDLIGVDASKRVMEVESGSVKIPASDLEIGGEGMRAFYDKMLVNETNKYIKKFGSKVEVNQKLGGKKPPKQVPERFEEFDNLDWSGFAGAEEFANGDQPLKVFIKGQEDWYLLDGAGFSLISEDGESDVSHAWGDITNSIPDSKASARAEFVRYLEKETETGGVSAHVFPITDKMKDAVSMGQPLYQTAQITEQKNFLKWFEGSKVVDKNEEPLVVYHGFQGASFDPAGMGVKGRSKLKGIYFTKSKTVAKKFAESKKEAVEGSDRGIVPVYLNMQNPLVADFNYSFYGDGGKIQQEPDKEFGMDELEQYALANGYDGIIAKRVVEGDGSNTASTSYVVFDSSQVKSATRNSGDFGPGRNIYKQPVRRGAVQFDDAGNRLIALFKDANESTLLHEFGHTWLEELRADSKDKRATGQLKADWETIKKWFADNGHPVGDDGAISVEAHELFARGIERYFMEGNAPTPELRSVFQTFKDWLLKIYRTVSSLNAPINKDVRAVFDRLIATEDAIIQARAKIGRRATFASAKEMGVADEVFEAYQKAAADANDRELSRAEKEAMAEVARQQDEEFRDALTRNREAVKKELEQRPEYRAIHWIRNGTLPDGSTIEGVAHARLDAAAVKALYPNDDLFVRRVQRAGLYSLQGGLDPEMVAPLFGYANADAMLRATVAAPRMAVLVKQEAERRTKEEFGDMLIDLDRRMNIALEAVHSDESGRILRAELAALRKLHKDSRPVVKQAVDKVKRKGEEKNAELDAANRALKLLLSSERKERAYENRWRDAEQNTEEAQAREAIASVPEVKWFRDAARKLVGASRIQDIDRQAALRTERAMSKQAFELAAKKDYAAAAQAKAWQLFNHYLYLEQSRALEQTAKIKKFAKGLTKSSAQERLGKAGQDYLDQVNALLERYEFKNVSDKKIDRRASLLEWIKEQESEGNEIAIPEEIILDARQINYQLLTFDGLNALHDALQNITQLARLKNKLLRNKQKVEYEETIGELLQALKESRPTSTPPPIDRNTISRWKKAGDVIDSLDATLLKAEQIFRWFDKEDPNGVWMQTVFQPIADAQGEENALTKTFTEKFAKMFEDYFADRKGVLWSAKLNPAIGQEMTHGGAIAVALNVGNAGNKEKLLKGYKWNEQQLNSILDTLTKEDWQFVQSVWNEVNSLWPQMKELQQRLTGVAPPKVEPVPVTTKFGVLQGGYFPVVYDERFSPVGEKQADAAGERLMERSYVKSTTSQGHTKARTKFYAPIKLDLEVIPQHMAQVIHDLTHREAIIQAYKVLNDKRVREEITNRMGLPYHKALNAWLKGVANSTNVDQTGNEFWSRVMARTRMNANIVAMGYKFTTIAANTLGYVQAMEQVNPLTLINEVRRFWMNPRKAVREVHSRSKEMEFRSVNIERDMRDLYLKNLGKGGALTAIHRHAFAGISLLDQAISTPTWRAAYSQAIRKGATEQEAINTADSIVRLTQSAGGPKDLASIQRASEFFKWATMFYSYFNMVYNRLRSLGKTNKAGAAKFMEVAWRSMILVTVPAVLGELLAGRGPDDDEDEAEWALKKILLYPAMTIPFARDLASALDSGFESRTPIGAFLNALRRTVTTADKVIEGEKDPIALAKPLNTALGYAVGLPAGQMNITGAYLWDLYTGEEVPESMLEVAKNLLYRREE